MPIPGIIASSRLKISGAYESIASATGTGSSGTITFSSIPSTYTSLQLRIMTRNNRAANFSTTRLQFNSITSTSYDWHLLQGDGATASASGAATQDNINIGDLPSSSALANTMGVSIIDIHDYASTTRNKTIRAFTGFDLNGSGIVGLFSGLFRNTGAITSITIYHATSDAWTTTSQFALYGIKGA